MNANTFACPRCGRRMAVQPEFAGRAVRCPHCQEVVVAPKASRPTTFPAPRSASPSFDVPGIDVPPAERPDSIFAEGGSDDDTVFEAAPIPANRLEIPDGPPRLEPAAVPTPPAVLANPWGGLDESAPSLPAPPATVSTPERPSPGPSPVTSRLKWALALVAGYAVLATAVAAWGWFRGGDRGHPLLFVPDTFGEYPPASRDRVADLRDPLRAMGWDGTTIPTELRARLGGRLAVGDLVVEPLAVELRRVNRVTVLAGNASAPTSAPLPQQCLVLALRLTNTSKTVTFHPTDPAFNRKAVATTAPPLTGVIVSDRARFLGGPVVWPYAVGVARSYMEGQEADAEPLRPGQTRRAVIVANDDPAILDAVVSATAPVTWQVHLRRGVTRVRGRDVSVGALIGVEFDPAALKRPGE